MDEALELWLGLEKKWEDFWQSTPKAAHATIAAMQKHQHQTILTQSWYNEYMARQKRLKGLSQYLKEPKTKRLLKKGEAMRAAPWLSLFGASSIAPDEGT